MYYHPKPGVFYLCTGCVPVPPVPYKKNKGTLFITSHLTKPEVVSVLSDIWSECNKVENMRLFNVAAVKPLRLDEFEVLQSQIHTQVLQGWGSFFFCMHSKQRLFILNKNLNVLFYHRERSAHMQPPLVLKQWVICSSLVVKLFVKDERQQLLF